MDEYKAMMRKRQGKLISKREWKVFLRKRRNARAAMIRGGKVSPSDLYQVANETKKERLPRKENALDYLRRIGGIEKVDPKEAQTEGVTGRPESPIEMKLCNAMKELGLLPICQFHVGLYRLDFAFPDCMLAIEADGHEFHSSKIQRTHDTVRQRALMKLGWQVVRFTGTEIHNNVNKCAREVFEFYSSAVLKGEL